jgi:chromosome segregation ATPase
MFGGSVKKPLMTKVSMRHLNEIVRERNQYSRDAMEAWQDFINLKGRMDMELTKVTKRNNFLVEELESWKQQFLKFQAFAEQLTKETQDLKVKIENHKRENRRLTNLIDQQKDDAARLAVRLSGTEKQRDDALEALVLQQEIAEELERERKRNKKELGALQHTSSTLTRQRDEAQRVVLHLRALIDGQAHHMEHIVKSLSTAPELTEYIEEGFEDLEEDEDDNSRASTETKEGRQPAGAVHQRAASLASQASRSFSRASTDDAKLDGEDVSPDMEDRLLNNPSSRKRLSQLSMADVADRHLRDKTDAIAYIIRNISEQCAAAVEGLQLAQRADSDDDESASQKRARVPASEDGQASTAQGSEFGDDRSEYLAPENRSTAPPTPDLVHNRSSTSMSMASSSTTPDRNSLQHYKQHSIPEMPTRIVETDDDYNNVEPELEMTTKYSQEVRRPVRSRITGLGPV